MATYFIVHKQSHILHSVDGCARAKGYSDDKYDEYETIEKAIANHTPDIRSCKNCVSKKVLDEITPHH